MVFEGYNEMSAKAMMQQRRASGKASSTITFTERMSVTLKKDNFLSNPKNKQHFLSMLSKALQNVGCITHHANGDADLLIVKTAVESARTSTTVLVGMTQICQFFCVIMLPKMVMISISDQNQRQTREVHASGI